MSGIERIDSPVFVGLSHIGQVFSVGWTVKFGGCAVFDFQTEALRRFQAGILTDEEPGLDAVFEKCRSQIEIYDEPERIRDHSLVFLTLDTPLSPEGNPEFAEIRVFLSRCIKHIGENATLIVLSQVYPGFCSQLQGDLLRGRPDIKLIYMVDTLIMGSALPRFLEPEMLIFGLNRREDLPRPFASFDCKQYLFSYQEAEMAKVALNLYLLFGVVYANAMDNYCRQRNFRFAPIAEALQHDVRVGRKAYIEPSLGISGGHLERDLSTIISDCEDKATRLLFEEMRKLNMQRMNLLYEAVEAACRERRGKTVLWIGASYKSASFSLINSPFIKFVNRFKDRFVVKAYDSYYSLPRMEGVIHTVDLASELGEVDCVIFNYAKPADAEIVERVLLAEAPPVVFDISLRPSLRFRGRKHLQDGIRRIF